MCNTCPRYNIFTINFIFGSLILTAEVIEYWIQELRQHETTSEDSQQVDYSRFGGPVFLYPKLAMDNHQTK